MYCKSSGIAGFCRRRRRVSLVPGPPEPAPMWGQPPSIDLCPVSMLCDGARPRSIHPIHACPIQKKISDGSGSLPAWTGCLPSTHTRMPLSSHQQPSYYMVVESFRLYHQETTLNGTVQRVVCSIEALISSVKENAHCNNCAVIRNESAIAADQLLLCCQLSLQLPVYYCSTSHVHITVIRSQGEKSYK